MKAIRLLVTAALAPLALLAPQAHAQALRNALAPAPGPCPVYKSPAIQQHIDKAYELEGKDLPQGLIPSLFILPRRAGLCAPARVAPYNFDDRVATPVKTFDQLYYVGNAFVGAIALKTSGGIILFDAMNNTDDVDKIIEPGLRQLGLNPADIKYVVISHGHADHFGGALALQQRYKAQVWMGDKDVPLLAAAKVPPPHVDKAVTDGTTLTLGDTTVKLYTTAGHTPASLSAVFPVTDHGTPHKVAIFGGYGLLTQLGPDTNNPPLNAGLLTYIAQAQRFRQIGEREGVDVGLSTHPIFDDTLAKTALVARDHPKTSPWVLGKAGWLRFMDANVEVARTVEAMIREKNAGASAR